jgi:hypothetical protein
MNTVIEANESIIIQPVRKPPKGMLLHCGAELVDRKELQLVPTFSCQPSLALKVRRVSRVGQLLRAIILSLLVSLPF